MTIHATSPPRQLAAVFGHRFGIHGDGPVDEPLPQDYGMRLVVPHDLVAPVLATDDPEALGFFCDEVHESMLSEVEGMPDAWEMEIVYPVRADDKAPGTAEGSYATDEHGEDCDELLVTAEAIAREMFPAWWLGESKLRWTGLEASHGAHVLRIERAGNGRGWVGAVVERDDVICRGPMTQGTPGKARELAERLLRSHLRTLIHGLDWAA